MMGLTFPATGMQMELLWVNNNPYAEFSAQQVNLDLTPYQALMIRYEDFSSYPDPVIQTAFLFVDGSRNCLAQYAVNANYSLGRAVRAASNHVYFWDCVGPYGKNNTVCVPYQIYGIQF